MIHLKRLQKFSRSIIGAIVKLQPRWQQHLIVACVSLMVITCVGNCSPMPSQSLAVVFHHFSHRRTRRGLRGCRIPGLKIFRENSVFRASASCSKILNGENFSIQCIFTWGWSVYFDRTFVQCCTGTITLCEYDAICIGTLAHAFWVRVSFPEVQSSVEAGRTDLQIAWPFECAS